MGKWMAGLISVLLVLLFLSQGYSREKLLNPGELYDSYMALYHKGKCLHMTAGPSSELLDVRQKWSVHRRFSFLAACRRRCFASCEDRASLQPDSPRS